MGIRCVLLDVDGTLVDSNDAHAHAWEDAFREAGFDVPFARVRRLIGMGGDKLIPAATLLDADHPRAQGAGGAAPGDVPGALPAHRAALPARA